MEGRVSRGRAGSWKRGGRGRNDGESTGGEHRGRGRGGHHHRGRNRPDHQRGRGRGAGFHPTADDEGERGHEGDRAETFSRRKLESNWDRYEESEERKADDEMPSQRGTDFHVLLESAGDSFSHFRFSEEKEWNATPPTAASQLSVLSLDLPVLAELLQQVPLHQRLHLDDPLLQVSTPVELPATPIPPRPPSAAFQNQSSCSESKADDEEEEDGDEELEQLLRLQKEAPTVEADQVDGAAAQDPPEHTPEGVKDENKEEEPKPEMGEEELEEWLDSIIS